MSTLLNKIVFTGDILDGRYIKDVREAAQSRLGMSPEELDLVFSGRRVVLKKGLTEAQADRCIRELAKLGMHVVRAPQSASSATNNAGSTPEIGSLKAQMLAQRTEEVTQEKRGGLLRIFSFGGAH